MKYIIAAGIALLCVPLTAGHAQDTDAAPDTPGRCEGLAAQISGAYKGVFYDNDFGYLTDPCLPDFDSRDAVTRMSDRLKNIEVAGPIRLSLGGEARLRFHHEDGIGLSRLDGLDNDFVLSRVRAYADVEVTEYFRGFVEVIDARQAGTDLPPRGIEVVRGDVLNGFAEVGAPVGEGRVYLRGGRQELLFGAQRLVSPLNWGNTRRSFDGVRAGYVEDDLTVNAWFVNPRVIAGRSSLRQEKADFSGLHATWTGLPGQTVEAYAYNLDRDDPLTPRSNVWTLGGRLTGRLGWALYDFEGAAQTGTSGNDDVSAGMVALGVGADFKAAAGLPATLWLYYDLATGDSDPDDGKQGTFDQLFPLAHAWLGFMDLVARQNVEAVSAKLTVTPLPKLRLFASVHSFHLAEKTDALYNAGGAPIRIDPTGAAGSHVGEEIDVTVRLSPLRWLTLEAGYSRFIGGRFIEETRPVGGNGTDFGDNADFFYSQAVVRF